MLFLIEPVYGSEIYGLKEVRPMILVASLRYMSDK